MKILNVSCGAVGAYFCGRLAEQGAEVAVTVRSDRELIAQKGFEIQSIAGDFIFRPQAVLSSAAEYSDHADYLVLTSKVLPDADAVELLRPAVQAGTVIVLIQNGLGIEDAIAEAFPENEILSAVAYIGVTRVAPGKLAHQGAGRLTIGKFGGGKSEAGTRLCQLFNQANVQADYTEDIAFYRWKKLLWNTPFNTVSVLGGHLDTKQMCDRGPMEDLCMKLMQETADVASSEGYSFSAADLSDNMEYTRNYPAYKTSMLVDYESGRPLEVDAILGNVCRIAKQNGVKVPHLDTCYALLQSVSPKG